MYKTMPRLMDNFRVGKKIWVTNDTSVSRALGGVAYALQTGIQLDEYRTANEVFARYRNTPGAIQEMMKGINHPDFFKTVFEVVLKNTDSGIIYKRKIQRKYDCIELHYDRKNIYRYEHVSIDFNRYGPRTFLSDKKLRAYLVESCLNAESKIWDIIEHDTECDAMDYCWEIQEHNTYGY